MCAVKVLTVKEKSKLDQRRKEAAAAKAKDDNCSSGPKKAVYKCTEPGCGKSCKSAYGLTRHIKAIHGHMLPADADAAAYNGDDDDDQKEAKEEEEEEEEENNSSPRNDRKKKKPNIIDAAAQATENDRDSNNRNNRKDSSSFLPPGQPVDSKYESKMRCVCMCV